MSIPLHSVAQAGVGTFTYTVDVAGVYTAAIKSYMQPNSGLTIAIKQNATTLVTSPAPLATQTHIDLIYSGILAAVNDTISFALTDSVATDVVTSTLNISAGTL